MAQSLVGTPYKYAGETEAGFDCSGFTRFVYQSVGVDLPHNAQLQSQLPGENLSLEEGQAGDLIFFGYTNGDLHQAVHAGILFADDSNEKKVVHCVSGGVSIDGDNTSWDLYWKERVLFLKRLEVFAKD